MVIVAFALIISLLLRVIVSTSVSLTELPAYQSQRPCVRNCFYWGASSNGGPDLLADRIGCAVDPIENNCFCRPDLQASADSYLKSCVNDRCNKQTIDVNNALSIYDSYCTSNGFRRQDQDKPTTVPATVTSQAFPTRTTTTTGGGGIVGAGPTSSTSSESSGTGSNKLSISTIIGIVVGSLVGLAFLAVALNVLFKWLGWGRKRKFKYQEHSPLPNHQPVYPPNHHHEPFYPRPTAGSEVTPDDSVSMVSGLPRPVPTLVSAASGYPRPW